MDEQENKDNTSSEEHAEGCDQEGKDPPMLRLRLIAFLVIAMLWFGVLLVGKNFVVQLLVKLAVKVLYASGESRENLKQLMGEEIDMAFATKGFEEARLGLAASELPVHQNPSRESWVGLIPRSACEVGVAEVGVDEVGACEVGAVEVGAVEVGAREVGAVEVSAVEVGAAESGAAESGADEVGPSQIEAGEVGPWPGDPGGVEVEVEAECPIHGSEEESALGVFPPLAPRQRVDTRRCS